MSEPSVLVASERAYGLAESPLWDAERQRVLGVDTNGRRSPVARLVDTDTDSRLNDGACDPTGRLLVGSMALDGREGEESLYRRGDDGRVTVVDDDLTLSNGLTWSPDGTVLYSVDSTPGIVYARPYNATSGAWGERVAVLRVDDGKPPRT